MNMKASFIVVFPAWEKGSDGEMVFVDEVAVWRTLEMPFQPFLGMRLAFELEWTDEYEALKFEKHFCTGHFRIEEAICGFDSAGRMEDVTFRDNALYEGVSIEIDGESFPSVEERDEAVLEVIHGYGFSKMG